MHRLYGNRSSGNCWKPAFMLRQRGIPFEWVEVDTLKRESRTPDFLARNPNGRVPLLQLPDGHYLAESNAMLLHLAEGSSWIPGNAYARAKAFEWMFFEQYSHEPFIATVRFWVIYLGRPAELEGKIAEAMPKGYAALAVMDAALARSPFLVGEAPSVADVALFAYTHVAHEGGFSLHAYPAVREWLARFSGLPGFAPMPCLGP